MSVPTNPLVKSSYEGWGSIPWHTATQNGVAVGKSTLITYWGMMTPTHFYNLNVTVGSIACFWTWDKTPVIEQDYVIMHGKSVSNPVVTPALLQTQSL